MAAQHRNKSQLWIIQSAGSALVLISYAIMLTVKANIVNVVQVCPVKR